MGLFFLEISIYPAPNNRKFWEEDFAVRILKCKIAIPKILILWNPKIEISKIIKKEKEKKIHFFFSYDLNIEFLYFLVA